MHNLTRDDILRSDDTILVGDFNIAPHEHDVWNHKALLKVVSHTEIETAKTEGDIEPMATGFDGLRHFISIEKNCILGGAIGHRIGPRRTKDVGSTISGHHDP